MNEDEIIQDIVATLDRHLKQTTHSRTFRVQTLLPGAESSDADLMTSQETVPKMMTSQEMVKKTPEHRLVRTDSQLQTLDAFLTPKPRLSLGNVAVSLDKSVSEKGRVAPEGDTEAVSHAVAQEEDTSLPSDLALSQEHASSQELQTRQLVDVQLLSVLELRQEVYDARHVGMSLALSEWRRTGVTTNLTTHQTGLEEIMKHHTFVGVIDAVRALIQHKTRLFMVNYHELR